MNQTKSKFPVTNIRDLYMSETPTGEIFLDALTECLRNTSTQSSSQVASYMGIDDERKLSNALQLLLGIGLKTAILEWRALQAKDMLDNPDLSLQEVANQCGFAQAKTLISFFSRCYGITPGVYRTGKMSVNSEYHINLTSNGRKAAQDILKNLREMESESDSSTDTPPCNE